MNPSEFLQTLRALRRRHGKRAGVTLTPAELVTRWNGAYTLGTLRNWRTKANGRRGPAFVRVSRCVVYPIAGVELFEAQMLSLIEEGKR